MPTHTPRMSRFDSMGGAEAGVLYPELYPDSGAEGKIAIVVRRCVRLRVWILFHWLWRSQICEESVPSGFAICLSNYSTEKLLRRVFCCWIPPVARYLQFNDLEFSLWHSVSCVIRRHGSFFYLVASGFPLSSLSDSAAVLFLLRVLRGKNSAKCSIAPCRVVRSYHQVWMALRRD